MSVRQRALAVRALVALSAAPAGLTLREGARVLNAYDSSARQALLRLVDHGLASRADSRYVLTRSRRADIELERAVFELGPAEILRIVTRASPAAELAAFDARSRILHLVTDAAAEPPASQRLHVALRRLGDVRVSEHSTVDVAGTAVEDVERRRAIRDAIAAAELLKGDLDRTLPIRERRGVAPGRPLGRLHPSVRAPSRRQRQHLARAYGLDEISIFGSATRADFRPDSDVDVLVHLRDGAALGLAYGGLIVDLARMLGRQADVVVAPGVEDAFIPSIERDRVTLYGRPHALVSRARSALRTAGDGGPRAPGRRMGRGSRGSRRPHASRGVRG